MQPEQIDQAAALLLASRAGQGAPAGFPDALTPRSAADGYAVQRVTMASLGAIGGWKVGAAKPDAEPIMAPLPAAGILESPAVWRAEHGSWVECEIAFRLGADLPPRDEPYTADEVRGAIASAHPAFELLASRFRHMDAVDSLSQLADLLNHGALVVGPAIEGWREHDLAGQHLKLTIDGTTIKDQRGGNPGGELIRLLVWLANEGATKLGGLKEGQVVTTGSFTGKDPLAPDATAEVRFEYARPTSVRLG